MIHSVCVKLFYIDNRSKFVGTTKNCITTFYLKIDKHDVTN